MLNTENSKTALFTLSGITSDFTVESVTSSALRHGDSVVRDGLVAWVMGGRTLGNVHLVTLSNGRENVELEMGTDKVERIVSDGRPVNFHDLPRS